MGTSSSPDFESLVQTIRVFAEKSKLKNIRVVFVSSEGRRQSVEISDSPDVRRQIEEAVSHGFLPLGLLGWEFIGEDDLQAKSLLFPWHKDPRAVKLFQKVCEEAVERVRNQIEKL